MHIFTIDFQFAFIRAFKLFTTNFIRLFSPKADYKFISSAFSSISLFDIKFHRKLFFIHFWPLFIGCGFCEFISVLRICCSKFYLFWSFQRILAENVKIFFCVSSCYLNVQLVRLCCQEFHMKIPLSKETD